MLTGLVNQKTFPQFIEAMVDGQPARRRRHRLGAVQQPQLPADLLLERLNTEGISKSALLDVITAHEAASSVRELLTAAYKQEANEKAALFRIVGEIADRQRPARAGRRA